MCAAVLGLGLMLLAVGGAFGGLVGESQGEDIRIPSGGRGVQPVVDVKVVAKSKHRRSISDVGTSRSSEDATRGRLDEVLSESASSSSSDGHDQSSGGDDSGEQPQAAHTQPPQPAPTPEPGPPVLRREVVATLPPTRPLPPDTDWSVPRGPLQPDYGHIDGAPEWPLRPPLRRRAELPIPDPIPEPYAGLARFYDGVSPDEGVTVRASANIKDPHLLLPRLVHPAGLIVQADVFEGMRAAGAADAFLHSNGGMEYGMPDGFVGLIERTVFNESGRFGPRLPIIQVRTLALAHFVLVALPRLHAELERRRTAGDGRVYGFVLVTSLNDDGPKYWLDHWRTTHAKSRLDCKECGDEHLYSANPLLRYLLASPLLAHWFAQNRDVSSPVETLVRAPFNGPVPVSTTETQAREAASLLTTLPIGIDYHSMTAEARWGHGPMMAQEQDEMMGRVVKVPFAERDIKIVVDTHAIDRRWLRKVPPQVKLQREALDHFFEDHPAMIRFRGARGDLWEHWATFAFVASPAGHGLDCHRTWEALALGAVPIVSYSPHMIDLYRDLPVVMVEKFMPDTLSEDNLKRWHGEIAANMAAGRYDMAKLTVAYWRQRFRQAALRDADERTEEARQ